MGGWSAAKIPDLTGKTAVVTGANSGIGLVAATELARHGAKVVMGCRSLGRGQEALDRIHGALDDAALDLLRLDLADLASIREFADGVAATHGSVDLLCNNAGIMAPPQRAETHDGFELQLGTNHFGHFALTGLLLEKLLAATRARVVTVSSYVHHMGKIDFDDLDADIGYERWGRYAQSKLANLLFHFELQRRFDAASVDAISVACHPGYAATNLQSLGGFAGRVLSLSNRLVAQPPEQGALPTLYAATSPDVSGGDFVGPSGMFEVRGPPKHVKAAARARDKEVARRLWELSEERTGVRFVAL